MDLGLGFDDEDLFIHKKRSADGDRHVPYNVKICTPEWFEEKANSDYDKNIMPLAEKEELHLILKYSGDLHYRKRQFSEAVEKYEAALDILPEANAAIRQDVRESLCRSYMYSGRVEESLNLTQQLVKELSMEDAARQRQGLILHSSICEAAGRWQECVQALEKLCCRLWHYERFWIQLGHAYVKLVSELFSTPAVTSDHKGAKGDDSVLTESDYLVLALTCFVKARLLLEWSLHRPCDVMHSRNKQLIEQTKEAVGRLPLPEEQKDFAYQSLKPKRDKDAEDAEDSQSEDGEPTENESKSSADVSNVPVSDTNVNHSKMFYDKFCTWMDHYRQSSRGVLDT